MRDFWKQTARLVERRLGTYGRVTRQIHNDGEESRQTVIERLPCRLSRENATNRAPVYNGETAWADTRFKLFYPANTPLRTGDQIWVEGWERPFEVMFLFPYETHGEAMVREI